LKGTGSFSAELVKPDGTPKSIESGLRVQDVSTRSYPLDLAGAPVGRAELRLGLELTTAAFGKIPGTTLAPQTASIPVDILPALGTPQLDPLLDFGRVEGSSDLVGQATLGITGPGCVWLPDGSPLDIQTGPEGLGQVAVTSAANGNGTCIRVAEGQRGEIAFELTAEQGGNGTLAGNLPVTVSPLDRPDRHTTVDVPFTADLKKPLQTLNFVLTLIAALVLGPGIPLLLLWLFKLLTAKIPGEPLSALSVPVVVRDGGVYRDGLPLALRETDFRDLVVLKTGGSRTAHIPGGTLKAKAGWSPFGAGYVQAEMPGRVALSSAYPQPQGRAGVARLPLAVHNTWIATHGAGDPPDAATIVLLTGSDQVRRQGLVDDIKARLPQLMASFGPTPAVPDWGAGPFDGAPAPTSSSAGPFGGAPAPTSSSAGPFGGAPAPTSSSADPFGFGTSTTAAPEDPFAFGGSPDRRTDPYARGWPQSAPSTSQPYPATPAPDPNGGSGSALPAEDWSFDAGSDDKNSSPGRH
jgi:hypothetical protein